jgi:hypothetical protein
MDETAKTDAPAQSKTPNLLHCGFVTDLKIGVAESDSGAGLLVDFVPSLKLPQMALILTPAMAVALRKSLQRMEQQFGWTENTVPPIIPPELVDRIKK